jgi:hypothetical protein
MVMLSGLLYLESRSQCNGKYFNYKLMFSATANSAVLLFNRAHPQESLGFSTENTLATTSPFSYGPLERQPITPRSSIRNAPRNASSVALLPITALKNSIFHHGYGFANTLYGSFEWLAAPSVVGGWDVHVAQ